MPNNPIVLRHTKTSIRRSFTLLTDLLSGQVFRFAKRRVPELPLPHAISVSQRIMPSESFENKRYNIRTAAQRIDGCVLLPGQTLSFWWLVGNPNTTLKQSRTIRNGKVVQDVGGGICQVSGIIYHTSLLAGLRIVERHNHSVDLYTDTTRFTPLGTDATVVYGHKDLRIHNPLPFPIQYQLTIADDLLTTQIRSPEPLKIKALHFTTEDHPCHIQVQVRTPDGTLINQSRYKKLVALEI